jgi:hypothetical protein
LQCLRVPYRDEHHWWNSRQKSCQDLVLCSHSLGRDPAAERCW